MASNTADRIAEGSAILDLQSFHCIRIVARPSLRRIIKDAWIKPPPAAGAGLEQHFWKSGSQPVVQVINPENIPVEHWNNIP